ncbi:MAG: Ig-like domain-containing protein [Longimicrobiales bacterium]
MRNFFARLEIVTVVALVAIPFFACSDGGGTAPEPPDPGVAAVVITPNELTLPVGGRGQLSAAARDAAGTDVSGSIIWSSLDQSIASTSSSGEVSGNRAGQTRVVAAVKGKADTVEVTVFDGYTLVVSPPSATVSVGGTSQFTVTAINGAGNPIPTPPVTWVSSAPGVATVDGNGLARGVTAGTTNITARTSLRTSQPAVLTVTGGACDGITSVERFEGTVNYGFKAVGIQTDGGFTIHADDMGHLTATMTRMQDGPFTAAWWGPIGGSASVTQRKSSTGVTTLNGGGAIIALPPAGLPQMILIVNLATCAYQFRAAAVISTRLVPEVGSPFEGPEMVAQVQFAGNASAWRSGGLSRSNGSLAPHSLLWGAMNLDKDAVMPLGLAASLFNPLDLSVGQGTGGFRIDRR